MVQKDELYGSIPGMASPESFRPKETRKEEALFPIKQYAVDSALFSIAASPRNALHQESAIIAENTALSEFVESQVREIEDERAKVEFLEGALWSHRILRYNTRERQLPKLSEKMISSFYSVDVDSEPGRTFNDIGADKLINILDEEKELSKGVRELVRYRSRTFDFYSGAYTVIGSYYKQYEMDKLDASLG